jgi:hypothetical protein
MAQVVEYLHSKCKALSSKLQYHQKINTYKQYDQQSIKDLSVQRVKVPRTEGSFTRTQHGLF